MQQDSLPDELGTLEEKAEAPLKSIGRVSIALPKVWVGYIIAAAFLIVEVGEVIIDPTTAERVTILPIAIYLGGWIYWLFCVHRMHKVIAEATDSYHPVTPGQAVGNHFIPFYNFYWIFKWPNEIADFVNSRLPSKQMAKGWAGFFLLIGSLLGYVDAAITLAVTFSVGLYLTRKIGNALDMTPERVMRKVTLGEASLASLIGAIAGLVTGLGIMMLLCGYYHDTATASLCGGIPGLICGIMGGIIGSGLFRRGWGGATIGGVIGGVIGGIIGPVMGMLCLAASVLLLHSLG